MCGYTKAFNCLRLLEFAVTDIAMEMADKEIAPLPKIGEATLWDDYKTSLCLWHITSGEKETQMGTSIAATFSNQDKRKADLRKKFLEQMDEK